MHPTVSRPRPPSGFEPPADAPSNAPPEAPLYEKSSPFTSPNLSDLIDRARSSLATILPTVPEFSTLPGSPPTVKSPGRSMARLGPAEPLRPAPLPVSTRTEQPPGSDSGSNDDSGEEEAYEIESILSHHLSDPRTHPPDIDGDVPVMLYRVKWLGYDEPTWEPAASFDDPSVIRDYWRRVKDKRRSGA